MHNQSLPIALAMQLVPATHFCALAKQLAYRGNSAGGAVHLPSTQLIADVGQLPHEPPQPLGPHDLPSHAGTHLTLQWPCSHKGLSSGHLPQVPPQ